MLNHKAFGHEARVQGCYEVRPIKNENKQINK